MYDFVGYRQKPATRTLDTFDFAFVTQTPHPFVATRRTVTSLPATLAFETPRINVISATEQAPEKRDFSSGEEVCVTGELLLSGLFMVRLFVRDRLCCHTADGLMPYGIYQYGFFLLVEYILSDLAPLCENTGSYEKRI